jgi:hypothetical protein
MPQECIIDEQTITRLGLKLIDGPGEMDIKQAGRTFAYPGLDKVYIMESDLYGNTMPAGSCFLAFYGTHGLIGKHLPLKTLASSGVEDIRNIVEHNEEG